MNPHMDPYGAHSGSLHPTVGDLVLPKDSSSFLAASSRPEVCDFVKMVASVHLYIYIYIYVCIYIYMCVYVYIYIYIHV